MSNISRSPARFHSFDVEEATLYGVNQAILLDDIRRCLELSLVQKDSVHDGYVWTYISTQAFIELFPYMGSHYITESLKDLRAKGVLMVDRHNADWYTIPAEFTTAQDKAVML